MSHNCVTAPKEETAPKTTPKATEIPRKKQLKAQLIIRNLSFKVSGYGVIYWIVVKYLSLFWFFVYSLSCVPCQSLPAHCSEWSNVCNKLTVLPQCSTDDLKQFYSKYGAVQEVNIPLKPGKNRRSVSLLCSCCLVLCCCSVMGYWFGSWLPGGCGVWIIHPVT